MGLGCSLMCRHHFRIQAWQASEAVTDVHRWRCWFIRKNMLQDMGVQGLLGLVNQCLQVAGIANEAAQEQSRKQQEEKDVAHEEAISNDEQPRKFAWAGVDSIAHNACTAHCRLVWVRQSLLEVRCMVSDGVRKLQSMLSMLCCAMQVTCASSTWGVPVDIEDVNQAVCRFWTVDFVHSFAVCHETGLLKRPCFGAARLLESLSSLCVMSSLRSQAVSHPEISPTRAGRVARLWQGGHPERLQTTTA